MYSNQWNDDRPGNEFRIADLSEREARIRQKFLPAEIELNSDEYWEYMHGLSKAEKWRQSGAMTKMLFDKVRAEIRAEHLGWSGQERKIEFVARMYGPTLAEGFRRDLEKKKLYGNSD
jgi:hypothetical protein